MIPISIEHKIETRSKQNWEPNWYPNRVYILKNINYI